MERVFKTDACNIPFIEDKIFKDINRNGLNPEYKKFADIDFEQREKIKNLSTSFLEYNKDPLMAQNYINILHYLSTSFGKTKLLETREKHSRKGPNYDEYLTFVITACDPDCSIYKTYIECDNDLSVFEKENIVRNKVGFFSRRLLTVEKDYYFKFINEILTNVGMNNSDYITLLNASFKNFNNVSQDRFDDINKIALLWRYAVDEKNVYTTCVYDLIYQSHLLNLNSLEERFVFLISAVDSELKLLEIFEDENRMNKIMQRSLLEVGFYNPILITIEREYKKRFLPDLKIGQFSK